MSFLPSSSLSLLKKNKLAFGDSLGLESLHNVGTNVWNPTVEYTSEDYAKVMSTNFESAFHFSQIAHPLLKASGVGSIVFVSSVAGLVYASAGPIYGATKGESNFFFHYLHKPKNKRRVKKAK